MTEARRAWLDRRARFVGRRLWAFGYPAKGRGMEGARKAALRLYGALLRVDLTLWCLAWSTWRIRTP